MKADQDHRGFARGLGAAALSIVSVVALAVAGSALISAGSAMPERDRSDRFWNSLRVEGLAVESYEDIGSMSRSADTVVVGRITSLEVGRRAGEPDPRLPDPEEGFVHFATATLAIEEVLLGTPIRQTEDEILIDVLLPSRDRLGPAQSLLISERAIFWLRDKHMEGERLGLPAAAIEQFRGFYRLVSPEGVVRDFGNKAAGPVGGSNLLSKAVEGRAFDTLLIEVRATDSQIP